MQSAFFVLNKQNHFMDVNEISRLKFSLNYAQIMRLGSPQTPETELNGSMKT